MKRTYATLVTTLVLSLSLAGCGGPGPTVTSTPTAGSTATSVTNPTSTPDSAESPVATVATGGKREKVRFAMDWTPNTNHTGIFVALQNGWYAEQGLDVEILPYSEALTPDTLVATGQAEFGVSFAEAVVTGRVSKLPVKSVAAILQTNTSAIATLKTSGLDSPSKLEGKRYAGFGTTYEEPVITTMLKSAGAPTGKFQNITTNLASFEALTSRQADFTWIYMGWQGVEAELQNVELNTFLLKDYDVPDYYTPVIIAGEKFLQEKGDVARRFLAATARGYEYGVTNPYEAADLLIKASPPATFADPALPRESQAYLAKFYKGDQPHWGMQTLEKWTEFPRFMASTGLLKTPEGQVVKPEDIDYASLFTNDYLPQP